jgi:hypothetical protein
MPKEIVYMRLDKLPKGNDSYYEKLKAGVVYKCVRFKAGYSHRDLFSRLDDKDGSGWWLEGFKQLDNIEVLTQIYSGKIIPEELP